MAEVPSKADDGVPDVLKGTFMEAAARRWDGLEQPKKVKLLTMASAVSFFLFFVILIVYTVSGVKKVTSVKPNVVVFMETNPEDLLALRYLLKRSDLRVRAVVLALNSWSQVLMFQYDTVLNLLALMSDEGCKDAANVEVYYGNDLPLRNSQLYDVLDLSKSVPSSLSSCSYTRIWPPAVQASADVQFGAYYQIPRSTAAATAIAADTSPTFYEDPIVSLISGSSADVIVFCFSSLTDFASLWASHSTIRSKITEVVVSGGSMQFTTLLGDVQTVYPSNTAAEFNFFMDPRAAKYVLGTVSAATNVVLVTFDAAVSASYTASQYSALVTDVAALTSTKNVSAALIALMLSQKRATILRDGQLDLTAPQDLVAAALISDSTLRSSASIGSSALTVVSDVRLSTDGTVVSSTSGTSVPYAYAVGSSTTFWTRISYAESAAYPS